MTVTLHLSDRKKYQHIDSSTKRLEVVWVHAHSVTFILGHWSVLCRISTAIWMYNIMTANDLIHTIHMRKIHISLALKYYK